MFSDKVGELLDRIGATSADIARQTGCAASNISRLRAGTRTPKPSSPTVGKLLDGAYLFAEKMNTLPLLCSVFGGNASDSAEEIKAALNKWLFENVDGIIPNIPVQRRVAPFRNFGDKLNAVMNMLELSNVRLGRTVNLDPSQISRFRGGVRTPKSNMLLVNQICDELLLRIGEQEKIPELAKLMNVKQSSLNNNEMREDLFCKWLCDFEAQNDSLDRLLDSIDTFSPDKKIPLPELKTVATDEILNKTDSLYWKTDGLREAAIRFLGNAVKMKAKELWLYSDQNLDWLVGDRDFQMKWLALMVGCVKNRTKIRIIHNIDRGTDEMLAAIQSWLPLYMSGMIEPYVFRTKHDARFSYTLFLCPESACIYASHIRGNEEGGWYDYVTEESKLHAFGDEFNALLLQSEPLVKIYSDSESYRIYENTLKDENSDLSVMLSSLSLSTMPQGLLGKLLDRNGITGVQRDLVTDYYDKWRQRKATTLDSGNVREFIPIPSDEKLFGGKVRVGLGSSLMDRELYYTPDEYAEHVNAVISLMNENTHYHFYILPESPFVDIQIIRQGDHVTVIKQDSPYAAFVFTHPFMVHAFDDYFEMLKKKYSAGRTNVRQALTRYV